MIGSIIWVKAHSYTHQETNYTNPNEQRMTVRAIVDDYVIAISCGNPDWPPFVIKMSNICGFEYDGGDGQSRSLMFKVTGSRKSS